MPALLVGILALLATPAVADVEQEVGRMNREVARLIEKGWIDVAADLADEAVETGAGAMPEEHPVFLEALRNRAEVSHRNDDDAAALQTYERVLAIRERSSDADPLELARCLDDLAAIHRATRSFDEAAALYRRALGLREQRLGPADPGLIDSLNHLAGLHQIRGELSEALALLERVVTIQEATLGPDHTDVVGTLKFMAAIARAQDDDERARSLLDRAVDIEGTSARRLPPADPRRGGIGITLRSTSSAGEGAGAKGRTYAAKVYFVRADPGLESFASDGSLWAGYSWSEQELLVRRTSNLLESTISDGGDVYLLGVDPGRYVAVAALLVYEGPGQTLAYHGYLSAEIIARAEVTVTPGRLVYMGDVRGTPRGAHDRIQTFLFNLFPAHDRPVIDVPGAGAVHYKDVPQWVASDRIERGGKPEIGFWNRTGKLLKNEKGWLPLVPERDAVGEGTPSELGKYTQRSQRALSEKYGGAFRDAVSAARKALAACESVEDHERLCLPAALGNLADLLASANELSEAGTLYERQREVRERTLGPGHPALAYSLLAQAQLRSSGGEAEEAAGLAGRAVAILEQSVGRDDLAVADALEILAACRPESEGDVAAAPMERALRIREDALGWTHLAVAPALESVARSSLAAGDLERARKLTERLVLIHERGLGARDARTGESLLLLADVHGAAGDDAEATALLERALEVQRDAYGAKHRRVAETMLRLVEGYEAQGREADVRQLRQQADELIQQIAVDDLHAIGQAMIAYAMDRGSYPVTSDIEALMRLLQPNYLRVMPLADGWGTAYVAKSDAAGYELRSLGKDGRPDARTRGATSTFDADIVFANGAFAQWPEGPQQ